MVEEIEGVAEVPMGCIGGVWCSGWLWRVLDGGFWCGGSGGANGSKVAMIVMVEW